MGGAGSGRRREKSGIVAETLVPGAVVTEVARRWQVCPQQVFGWRREARVAPASPPVKIAVPPEPAFVPLVAESLPAAEAASIAPKSLSIEVRLAGVVVPGMDGALLTMVLRAVRTSASAA